MVHVDFAWRYWGLTTPWRSEIPSRFEAVSMSLSSGDILEAFHYRS